MRILCWCYRYTYRHPLMHTYTRTYSCIHMCMHTARFLVTLHVVAFGKRVKSKSALPRGASEHPWHATWKGST